MTDKKVNTTVTEYFTWLEKTVSPDSELYKTVHDYLENGIYKDMQEESGERPFLSVITRTQGKRGEMLREALLCLTGQTCTDFEVLVMGHDLNTEQKNSVEKIIAELPEDMRNRTRLIEVNGGNRTTPLNRGFEAASGKYTVLLDDDDIVFSNWVETFYEMSKQADGKVLHTYMFDEEWETVGENSLPRAAGAPKATYFKDYILMNELVRNSAPQGSVAYPSYVFKKLGVTFDETLTTTEDWDFILRTVFLAGVCNNNVPTAIYRKWKTAENSTTVHKKDEWDKNYKTITDRLCKTPVVMPSGFWKTAAEKVLKGSDSELDISAFSIYYDTGSGFAEGRNIKFTEPSDSDEQCLVLAKDMAAYGDIYALRIDPCERGNTVVENLKVVLIEENGLRRELNISDFKTNGINTKHGTVFLKPDPQFIFRSKTPLNIREMYVDFKFTGSVSDELMAEAMSISYLTREFSGSLVKKIKGVIKSLK